MIEAYEKILMQERLQGKTASAEELLGIDFKMSGKYSVPSERKTELATQRVGLRLVSHSIFHFPTNSLSILARDRRDYGSPEMSI